MNKYDILDRFAEMLVREAYDAALWPVEAYIEGSLKKSDEYTALEDECKTDDDRKMFIARMTAETLLHRILHWVSEDHDRIRLLFRQVEYDEETDEISEASDWLDLGDAFQGELQGLVVGDEGNWLVKYSKYPSISSEISRREEAASGSDDKA